MFQEKEILSVLFPKKIFWKDKRMLEKNGFQTCALLVRSLVIKFQICIPNLVIRLLGKLPPIQKFMKITRIQRNFHYISNISNSLNNLLDHPSKNPRNFHCVEFVKCYIWSKIRMRIAKFENQDCKKNCLFGEFWFTNILINFSRILK